VIGFLGGELGEPAGGWPEPFRTRALAGRSVRSGEQALTDADRQELRDSRRDALNRLLFPGPTEELRKSQARYGDLSVLPTREFLYGLSGGGEHAFDIAPGKRLFASLEAIGEPDARGERTVMCTLNGQLRPVSVRDHSVERDVPAQEKADPGTPGQVPAPFAGVVSVTVAVGDEVTAGQAVATIEAMKMEASITAPVDGRVTRLAVRGVHQVEAGDLLLVIG